MEYMEYLQKAFEKYQSTSGTLQNTIYHALKDGILYQQLPSEIAESQISLALDVSRTPVGEAMQKLSAEGFLEIQHGRRARVKYITEEDIRDICRILKELHLISVELCIANATDEELHQLEETLKLMEFYTQRRELEKIVYYNTLFHLKICKLGKNKWLYNIMENLMNYTFVFRSRVAGKPGRMDTSFLEHTRIYQLLLDRNLPELQKFVRQHVDTAFQLKT